MLSNLLKQIRVHDRSMLILFYLKKQKVKYSLLFHLYLRCSCDKASSFWIGKWSTQHQLLRKMTKIEPGNYRVISLTSVVGKLLGSIIKDKIVSNLKNHPLIKDSLHGFRYKRSFLLNLLAFCNDLFTLIGYRLSRFSESV